MAEAVCEAYVGLGANLGDPPRQLLNALDRLANDPEWRLEARSRLWRSPAIGPQPQPDYCNAVCRLRTRLEPEQLLGRLLDLEDAAGRTREQRWGPRLLDLDLLHVPGVRRATTRLTLPHPQIARRDFVLRPWAEIAPGLVLPGLGSIAALAAACANASAHPWPPLNNRV
jgi:2-amino-4-hydroxy-6-hydroxymethyldihydropteridine pyrophosphokinase